MRPDFSLKIMIKQISMLLIIGICSNLSGKETEVKYLSGSGRGTPVLWDFMITSGRQANVWTTIPVPSNWELQGFGEYNYGHDKNKADEKGMYRYRFNAPVNWDTQKVYIVFEGAMTDTEVKINGQLAGPPHQGGYYRFEYDISSLLVFGTENLLEVTVSKMSANESINLAERRADYWVFGGIFRPVYLKILPPEHISWTAVNAQANGHFEIEIYLEGVEEADRIEASIWDIHGKKLGNKFFKTISGGQTKYNLSTRVSGQKNWTAETPNLYYADIELKKGPHTLHTTRERFGFRTIEVREGKGIFLNNRRIILKGCNRHSFWPKTGRALSYNRCYEDVMLLKEMNMNAVRMSHYPPDSYFLELCDEQGIYVLDELAGWQKPAYDTATAKRLVKQLVKRDVNHPSILFWDNGNEGGWNAGADDEFIKYDPQKRRVLHPWELFGGIDTDHYEGYESVLNKLEAENIFMPTEHLHGLYDGGHGAGLDDFWKLMWGHPLNGGMFLWSFADEAVIRTDKNGVLDSDGSHAPDGILGPFHEKEASFYTIKEVWSPIYIDTGPPAPGTFTGKIAVENRFDFINLNQCRFEWKLVHHRHPSDRTINSKLISSQNIQGPNIAAHDTGFLTLDLPQNPGAADALHLTAYWEGKEVSSWKWKLTSNKTTSQKIVEAKGRQPFIKNNRDEITVLAGNFTFSFSKKNGRLISVKQDEHKIHFSNGPRFVADSNEQETGLVKIETEKGNSSQILKIGGHADFDTLEWTIYGDGWLKLDFAYTHYGPVDYLGISFDFPKKYIKSMKWLGKGPYRVWKNRLKGPTVDVWEKQLKDYAMNTAWDFPEFPGYYANINWVVFKTKNGAITIATDQDELFMRIFSQQDGHNARHTSMIWPEGDISFLHAIPAIGTKFQPAEVLGPQSKRYQAEGKYQGTLYFYFGVPAKKTTQ